MAVAKRKTAKEAKKTSIKKKSVMLKKSTVKKTKKVIKKTIKKKPKTILTKLTKKTPKKMTSSKKTPKKPILKPHSDHQPDYMNAEQREHFRKMLLSWKRQLLHEMERTVHHMQDDAANFPDPNDRATQEEEFSLELRARDRERKLIKKIDESLRNIDKNDYGYCEACGVEIGAKRLEARPTATLCIDCKTIDEIREKHYS